MVERQHIPQDLDSMPPGPELGAVLAGLDPDRLTGHDAVVALRASRRYEAFVQARSLKLMTVIAHSPPGDADSPLERVDTVSPFAAEEIRFALNLTRQGAQRLMRTALELVEELPAVHDALSVGRIDYQRAWIIADRTCTLEREQRRAVADVVLERAPQQTAGQLREAVNRAVVQIDPEAAKRRYQMSVRARRVEHRQLADGTAGLFGLNLPVEAAAAAAANLDALARASKRAGDPRTLAQLRADHLLELATGRPVPPPAASQSPDEPAEGNQPPHVLTGAVVPSATVHLHVNLSTLIGLNDEPGHIPGWGPVIADIARDFALKHPAEWRWRLTDDQGVMIDTGKTTARPTQSVLNHVRDRDITCRAPGCRMPAHQGDIDHTVSRLDGGDHTPDNLGALCRHHHRAKHEGGWRLSQPSPGYFVWVSPLGHPYVVNPDTPAPP